MTEPLPPTTSQPSEPLVDLLGRPLRDLRISVTDRCNFRCRYCMPREVFGADFAFLDPVRNPELAKAVANRPFRRLVQEWAANHAKDPAATAAAEALLKVAAK